MCTVLTALSAASTISGYIGQRSAAKQQAAAQARASVAERQRVAAESSNIRLRQGQQRVSLANEMEEGARRANVARATAAVSAGLQVGVAKVDLLFFIMDEQSKENLLDGSFGLEIGANVTIGEDELNGEIDLNQPIYSVVNSKGVFAGVTLEGSYLKQVEKSNRKIYGPEYTNYEILSTSVIMPAEVSSFTRMLNYYTR